MFPDNKNTGDAGHIGLELLENVPETEQRCFAATKAMKEGYFSLDDALETYEITREDYVKYLIKIVLPKIDESYINNILMGVFLTLNNNEHPRTDPNGVEIQTHLDAIGQLVAAAK